ncbi:MAG TPA: HyaD/HybD family hydrogenase maturation endopeptidase [Gemmatimonadaceae bacterium]|nr:HyaD/HybD family hydrogenase maturation endopeptidase [Gemmatimonadaceae bacterium]
MMTADHPRTVVLGLGNLLMADDGVGLIALARLEEEWFVPRDVELVDGGTWGMNLLPVIEKADRVIFLDAIDLGDPPGTLIRLEDEEIPRFLGVKLSPHQIDLREVLALAELRGTLPGELVALGIQPARVELSTTLSPVVEARLDQLVHMAAETLMNWGFGVCRWSDHGRRTRHPVPRAGSSRRPSPVSHLPSPISSHA